MITVQQVEKATGISADKWEGFCHHIACYTLDSGLVKGKARYGHFRGKVHPKSIFADNPVPQHGWIELEDGSIIDPTRWAFENKKPYIYHASESTDYDAGGNDLRREMMSDQPAYTDTERQIEIPDTNEAIALRSVLGIDTTRNVISISEAMWVANLPLDMLDIVAKPVFETLVAMKLTVFIPVDNKELVLG